MEIDKYYNGGNKKKIRNINGLFVESEPGEKRDPINTWLNWILALIVLLFLALIGIIITTSITADRLKGKSCDSFRYQVPFVCGLNPFTPERIRPGNYTTSIIISNPNDDEVEFHKKIALSFPPQSQEPGFVSNSTDDSLNSCQTLIKLAMRN